MEGDSCSMYDSSINHSSQKYPCCIVWTPIPLLTWFFPFIGHMGIATSQGVIRDFAGPYHVSTGNMAFGKPTKYWQLDPLNAVGGVEGWDKAVFEASEIYKNRNVGINYVYWKLKSLQIIAFEHNLCCDNCHSHVAMALNKMMYNNSCNWNMVKLAFLIFAYGKYVSFLSAVKTWLPFFIVLSVIITLVLVM